MRKLNRLLSFTNLISKHRCAFYSTHVRLQRKHGLHLEQMPAAFSIRSFSVVSSPQNTIDDGIKQLTEEFPCPKKILWRIINEAFCIHQKTEIMPSTSVQQISSGDDKKQMWQVIITLNWPEKFQVEGVAGRKTEAENIAYLYACQKMKNYGILDENNNVLLPKNISIFGNISIKNAKGELMIICQKIWTRYGRKDYMPKFINSKIAGLFGKEICWKSVLHVTYPEEKTFEGYALRLRDAESVAATKALHWLHEKGTINKKRCLIEYTKDEEQKFLKLQSAPHSVCIPEALQEKMVYFFNNFEEVNEGVVTENNTKCEKLQNQDILPEIYDLITEKLYQELSEEEIIERCREMFEKNTSFIENSDPELQEIKSAKSCLPVNEKREQILRLIDENQVVVLSGETGCGKTTQVPQFILEHFVSQMKGAHCNIVVTQPRRISAITIAERVATERGEKVGETIGYQVRLNKNLPQKKGAILYCSTGMLLRKLCFNPNVAGVSHIIIDEVHERNIQIDFLLILLKKLLEQNKDIKILLMSASFNTHVFSQYFDNCPVIHVPGKMYPVKEYFLEDIEDKVIPNVNKYRRQEPVLDVDLVVSVINHIDASRKPGAILCFLPGWHDIQAVSTKLQANYDDPSKLLICPAHSRLPHDEQKNIFKKPDEGCRKVILATNIAETSITVEDVVYVVNSGLHKGTSFDSEHGVSSLCTQWITKANVRQRRGRAGRVQSGVCYHLFPRKVFIEMEEYPLPELLRMPLESVILDCKLYCPDTKAEDFLSLALQAPSKSALHLGVNELQVFGVLDKDENLTNLGKVVVNFATHPRLSVALIYGAFLGCLDPILTICALLTLGKEPFANTLENMSFIKEVKKRHDNFMFSDHLSLSKIYDTWKSLSEESECVKYITENELDENSLSFVKQLKCLFAEDLYNTGIINERTAFADPLNECSINNTHVPSILAALTAAFYPNVMKIIQGEISHGRLNKDAIIYSLLKGQRGYIQKESVASNEYELPSPWIVYFSALQSAARRLMMTSSVSSVPGICLLLFAGQELEIIDHSDDKSTILLIDKLQKLNFSCSEKEADLLIRCRNYLNKAFAAYVKNLSGVSKEQNSLSAFRTDFIPILKELLDTPQVPFTKGHFYKFVNNELVTEEW